ncbi:uncharacterized protein LOC110038516 [Phalaenopsis equestris]|uniref:uncharacterized protein LOC110038516 n=1 Tax=Phalaenopsis equestris TaxID=78828 RepID=UPI0009E59F41|nr:uncharacterized protein LOC110038516 [Phalaenopsis equestris]
MALPTSFMPFIYAGCKSTARHELWQQLQDFSYSIREFWIFGGNFTCLSSPSEKKGGTSPDINLMNIFNDNIQYAGLFDLGFIGPKYTWRRGKIWERLDRVLWEVVENIDSKVLKAEQKVLQLEQLMTSGIGSEMDLQSANEHLLDAFNMQEDFYAQKANIMKFCHGDRNSNYCHACINYRRKCNTIHKILSQEGHWITTADGIAGNAVQYFQNIFKQTPASQPAIQYTLFHKEREFEKESSPKASLSLIFRMKRKYGKH